jgi:hypothetical protein
VAAVVDGFLVELLELVAQVAVATEDLQPLAFLQQPIQVVAVEEEQQQDLAVMVVAV